MMSIPTVKKRLSMVQSIVNGKVMSGELRVGRIPKTGIDCSVIILCVM
jgi:hypothetical protein